MEVFLSYIINYPMSMNKWTQVILGDKMNIMSNHLSETITPETEPMIWYTLYEVIKEDEPELIDQFIEDTATTMELPVDYLIQEFL